MTQVHDPNTSCLINGLRSTPGSFEMDMAAWLARCERSLSFLSP